MVSTVPLMILFLSTLVPSECQRMTCAQKWFQSGNTDSGHVWCGAGFHECGHEKQACCSDVYATPIQLAIIIICPVAMVLSFLLLAFVIYTAVSVVKADQEFQYSKNKVGPLSKDSKRQAKDRIIS